jgi:hypothetical protein
MGAKTLFAWIIGISLISIVVSKPFLYVKNHKIYDLNGGERIFHGVNLVAKSPPYYEPEFDERDLIKLKGLGINGLRLGVMWPGVQPKADFFDE